MQAVVTLPFADVKGLSGAAVAVMDENDSGFPPEVKVPEIPHLGGRKGRENRVWLELYKPTEDCMLPGFRAATLRANLLPVLVWH
jgi:hypothetical protein